MSTSASRTASRTTWCAALSNQTQSCAALSLRHLGCLASLPQLLLDWELGDDLTGMDVARAVRALDDAHAQMRIVIVSGNERADSLSASEAEELSSLGIAATDWWVKPATQERVNQLLMPTEAAAS